MKFFEILLGFLSQQGRSALHENAEAVARQVADNARKVSRLLAFTVIFIILFCSGFTMAYTALVASIQHPENGWLSATLIGGIALAIASAAGMAYSLGERRWQSAMNAEKVEAPKHEAPPQPSPIENAIAVVLLEVVNELRERRKHAAAPTPPTSSETP